MEETKKVDKDKEDQDELDRQEEVEKQTDTRTKAEQPKKQSNNINNKSSSTSQTEYKNILNSLNWLIHRYFVRGEYEECLEVLSKHSKTKTGFESAYSLIIKGLIQRSGGNINESQILFKQSNLISTSNSYLLREMGKNFLLLGKFTMSIEIYDSLLSKNNDDWDSHYHKAVALMNLNKHKDALASLSKAYDINSNEKILLLEGKINILTKNYKNAIEKYEEALTLCPNNFDIISAIGSLYLKLNDSQSALDYFTNAINLNPKYSDSLLGLASIYQYQAEYEQALYQYKLANVSNPSSSLMWNNLGLCFFAKNKLITATSCLKKAIYFDPFQWIVHYNLGLIYLSSQQYASAFIYMNAAASLKNEHPVIFMYLGVILSELDDIASAINYYDRSIQLKPTYVTYYNYTVSLVKKDMYGNAKEKFAKFKEMYNKERNKNAEDVKVINEAMGVLNRILK